MASVKERYEEWQAKVRGLRREEDAAVDAVQRARRAYEAHRHSPEKHAVQAAEKQLEKIRDDLRDAEASYEKVAREYADQTPLDRREDYWRDQVQDRGREVERRVKIVQRLRREEKRDHDNAIEERRYAVAHRDQPDAHEAADAARAGDEELVFTKKQLTAAEAALVEARNARHEAELRLAKVRKQQHDARGGGDREKVVRAALASMDHQAARYSQGGSWSLQFFPGGEPSGVRSDCSQWYTKMYYHAGCPDPNGEDFAGGYTGTLGAHGRRIERSELRPGDAVLYGTGTFHHVEMYVGTGEGLSDDLRAELRRRGFDSNSTIGHGSPPVDEGTVDLLAGPKAFRSYL